MNTLIFGLLTIISLFVFLKLGKIKASTKQLNRDNRIKWRQNQNQILNEDMDNSQIEDEKPRQISDQSDK
tara:strand:- start:1068 stop:1277 length:210 start_codon:yes stop_codon:yes gene_type:complete